MSNDFEAGAAPLLISVPHAGTDIPDSIANRMRAAGRALVDTDWHVDRLVEGIERAGAGVLRAGHSRYVVDLNRSPEDQPLYPGAGTGLVPVESFSGEALYQADREPDAEERRQRVERFWQPYHDRLRSELDATRKRHGFAVLLDVHSIASRVPRLFEGRLPDLNLGTFDGRSADADLIERARARLSQAEGFTTVVDGRFKGGYITRHYGQPSQGVHALQIEIAQAAYMNEHDPQVFDPARARPLMAWLEQFVASLADWRPA